MKRLLLVIIMIGGSATTHAGSEFMGTGADKEEACWDTDRRANTYAYSQNTCYHPCAPTSCRQSSNKWQCTTTAANQEGSCRKQPKSYLKPVRPDRFRPRPGSATTQTPDRPPGKLVCSWRPHQPKHENAELIFQNIGGQNATIIARVSVRDSRYPNSKGSSYEEILTIPPDNAWSNTYHQFGAADWKLQTDPPISCAH